MSRIICEDDLDTFRTGLESAYETKYADAERILRAELEQVIVLSNPNAVNLANASIDQEQAAMGERMRQFAAATEVRVSSEGAVARTAVIKAEIAMTKEHAKEMKRVLDLHNEAHVANEAVVEEHIEFQYEAWKQFEQLQLWYQNSVREFASEQATLACRAAAIEAAGNVREQERQVNLNVISAVAERRLKDKYVKTLEKLREERDFHLHQNGSLLQEITEAQNIQLQMQEHYGREAPKNCRFLCFPGSCT